MTDPIIFSSNDLRHVEFVALEVLDGGAEFRDVIMRVGNDENHFNGNLTDSQCRNAVRNLQDQGLVLDSDDVAKRAGDPRIAMSLDSYGHFLTISEQGRQKLSDIASEFQSAKSPEPPEPPEQKKRNERWL